MKYNRFFQWLLILPMLMLTGTANAADTSTQTLASKKYALYLDFDKKTLIVDSLDLPMSNNVESLIRMLPELLTRPGSDITTYYNVKINGMSLGDNYWPVLQQVLIADVEKIEIEESPVSTYTSNGQGGSIDIILRDERDGKDKKWWGTASLGAGYQTDLMPYVALNYNTEKVKLQGLTFGELENKSANSTTVTSPMVTMANNSERERNHFLGAFMKYNPNAKDALSLKFIEGYNYYRCDATASTYSNNSMRYTTTGDTSRTFQTRILGNYQRQFTPRWKMELEAQYSYSRNHNGTRGGAAFLDKHTTTNTFSGTANTVYRLISGPGKNYGDIKIGADYNITNDNSNNDQNNFNSRVTQMSIDSHGHSVYVMPYLNWECRYRNFKLKLQGEYQIFNFDIKRGEQDTHEYRHNDFTGMLVMEQQIATPHHLRLMVMRKIQRPSLDQVYPFELMIPDEKVLQMGNSDLLPMLSHEVMLDYISRYNFGAHKITIDISGEYNRVTHIINDSVKTAPLDATGIDAYSYRTYFNGGHSDVWSANLMVFYKYKSFACSVAANLYNKRTALNDNTTWGTYYNLSIMPSFSLPSGWSSSLFVAYHSTVKKNSGELGKCAYTQLNIGKMLGRFNLYFFQKSSFTGDVTDTAGVEGMTTEMTYPLVISSIGLGLQYLF